MHLDTDANVPVRHWLEILAESASESPPESCAPVGRGRRGTPR
jgi:hypothetical protein